MKYHAFYVLLFTIACGNNSSIKEKQFADNMQNENKSQEATTSSSNNSGDEDIIGEWKLTMTVLDKNRNNKMDEEEKAEAMQLNDYLKLNRDGSAIFSQVKAKGRYEIKSNSDGTSKYLNLYDKDNFKIPYGRIISVTKSELILFKNSIGSVFFIWKRS